MKRPKKSYIVAHRKLLSVILDHVHFHCCVGRWAQKERVCEGLDSCSTLSILLMGTKLDCQKLWCCLSKYFFVDSSLSTNIMYQNYPKMEHSEIGNTCYGY
jgi:hypothetical protein